MVRFFFTMVSFCDTGSAYHCHWPRCHLVMYVGADPVVAMLYEVVHTLVCVVGTRGGHVDGAQGKTK